MRAPIVERRGRVFKIYEAELEQAHMYVVLNHGRTVGMRM